MCIFLFCSGEREVCNLQESHHKIVNLRILRQCLGKKGTVQQNQDNVFQENKCQQFRKLLVKIPQERQIRMPQNVCL